MSITYHIVRKLWQIIMLLTIPRDTAQKWNWNLFSYYWGILSKQ